MLGEPESPYSALSHRGRRILLSVQYDGTAFCGWQRQDGARSVQGELERAIQALTGHAACARASSRTDAGVHARALPVLFRTDSTIRLYGVRLGLIAHLPEDISVLEAREVSPAFHVRWDALSKTYVYRIWNHSSRSPLLRLTSWNIHTALDLDAMREGAQELLGEHDFEAYRSAQCDAPTSVRRLDAIDISGGPDDLVMMEITGNAFLRNMVRIIAGSLVEVGLRRKPPEWIGEVLAGRDRKKAGQTAPACGLTLDRVVYGPEGAHAGRKRRGDG